MNTQTRRTPVVVAGAGIGGLTTALALHAEGIEVVVVEKARELRALGVGINLLPQAVRELHVLGLGDALGDVAVAPHSIGFYSGDGDLLLREPRGVDGGYGFPQLSVHRGALQMLLLDAVRERIGDVVHTASGAVDVVDAGSHVDVQLDDGELRGRALIGADGIGSVVRNLLHADADPLLWSGIRMMRGAARMTPFLDGRTMAIIKGANDVDLVTYPIGENLVNWVLQVPDGEPGPLPHGAGWNRPGDPEEARRLLSGWTLDWLNGDDLVAATDAVFEYPMVDRNPLSHWGTGRVTLLGDAAHPMYPVGANGGSQAVVDATALARHLAAADDDVAGLRSYESERLPATAEVVFANRKMHEAGSTTEPTELAEVAADYRRDTRADRPRGN